MNEDNKKSRKWSEMTYEERKALLPKNLNKLGQWFLDGKSGEYEVEVTDMEAVLE